MTLEQFQTAINGKLFIELNSQSTVSSFTDNTVEPNQFRVAADNAGVLVFLTSIKKIYAKGYYYGGDFDAILPRIVTLEQQITSLGTPLSHLVDRVAQNESDISDITDLIGDAQTANSILGKIANIENELATITGGQTIGEAVDTYLAQVLDDKVAELGYLKSTDTEFTNLSSAVTTVQNALAGKAAQSDFSALVAKLGTDNWNQTTDGTVVSVINDLRQSTQSLTTNYNSLSSAISGIPRFQIQVCELNTNTKLPNISTPDPATIYLCPSPEDEAEGNTDMYTEWIYINRNAGKYDNQEPPQPLAADYGWEKLGRQAFKMNNYLDKDTIDSMLDDLKDYIDSHVEGLTAAKIAQITTNQTNIGNLQTAVQAIQQSLAILLDSEGNFLLTGEDIKTTSDSNSQTIATDIASLKSGKLDTNAINWVVISE